MSQDTSNSLSLWAALSAAGGVMGWGWAVILAADLAVSWLLLRCGLRVRRFPAIVLAAVETVLAAARRLAGR
jgi:hypothetical protein